MTAGVFIAIRRPLLRDSGPALLYRFDGAPWLEDVAQKPAWDALVCPLAHAGSPALLVVSRHGTVSCPRCRNQWPFHVQAQVDIGRDGQPVLTAGQLEAYPTACMVCGCTDEHACAPPEGPCWWIAPGVCSTHDVRPAAVPA